MTTTAHSTVDAAEKSQQQIFLNVDRSGLLQRKCDCGKTAGITGACSDCQSLQTKIQPGSVRQSATAPVLHELIQPKLTIGAPNDRYEQEADRVADTVMRMPDIDMPQSIEKEKEAEATVQTKSVVQQHSAAGDLSIDDSIESRLSSTKGQGSPLPDEVRSFMEPRFGADFSQVRVHTGNEAVQMNQDLNAQAFTHKQDVYFGAGKAPAKDALTAHELTHVVQQNGGVRTKQTPKKPDVQLNCSACDEEEKLQRSVETSSVLGIRVQRSWFGDDDDEKEEPENSSGGGILDWAKEKANEAVDTVTQAGGDAYDWAKEKGGAAVDTVTQAGGDAYDWAKEKGGAAVGTVTQAGGDAADWAKDKASGAVDTVSQAGGDAVDWAKEKGGAVVDTVTQAEGDAVDWAKDKGGAVVDTVTQAGGDAVNWAKEKGEQFSKELLEQKKLQALSQIDEARQQLVGRTSVQLTASQIAGLNGHLATLREKSQGLINLPGISAGSSNASSSPEMQAIDTSVIQALLVNLESSISAPFMSPLDAETSNSGTIQGTIQRFDPGEVVEEGVRTVQQAPPQAKPVIIAIVVILLISALLWVLIKSIFEDSAPVPAPQTRRHPNQTCDDPVLDTINKEKEKYCKEGLENFGCSDALGKLKKSKKLKGPSVSGITRQSVLDKIERMKQCQQIREHEKKTCFNDPSRDTTEELKKLRKGHDQAIQDMIDGIKNCEDLIKTADNLSEADKRRLLPDNW